ncbi:MAG: YggS family pyridoxal phosphate-dependent enzyme [Bacillota bacterium]
MVDIKGNIAAVRQDIAEAAVRTGRNVPAIKIIAVTKTIAVDKIKTAIEAGLTALGENRVQEMTAKMPELPADIEWHLIGHLQTNKVKYIADRVSMIHSMESLALAKEIDRRGSRLGRRIPVLVQVNVAGETAKFGLRPGEVADFVAEVGSYPGLAVSGLMTMAPYVADPEEARPVFRELRELGDRLKTMGIPGVTMDYLSMGMSNDYKIAVEEGANLLRIGSRIFGERY